MDVTLNIHAMMRRSRANGPGDRYVIWRQGCALRCPGCFNPDTHSHQPRSMVTVEALVFEIATLSGQIDGVTISDGEPLEQMAGLLALLRGVRERACPTVIVFTGHSWERINALPRAAELMGLVDVLIAGGYDESHRIAHRVLGSSNKTVR